MSDEASKTRRIRGPEFDASYLQGRVIDIGCGPDLVAPHAEPFDLADGDAQTIAAIRAHEHYDTVYSSHCLEHMRDVPAALAQWWTLVRKGGYLVLVVPDEDLYEQGGWPSLFNPDHKATFTMGSRTSWSPVSHDIVELVNALPDVEWVSSERQDAGYDYSLQRRSISPLQRRLFGLSEFGKVTLRKWGLREANPVVRAWTWLLRRLGAPADQTAGAALAQIQIVARKRTCP